MRMRADRRSERRGEAQARQSDWQKLTPQQQLKDLDARLGVGMGAKRQRGKLLKAILGKDIEVVSNSQAKRLSTLVAARKG